MPGHDDTPTSYRHLTYRTEPMTLLIPDARRSLLGGLIDDGALLRPSPPTVASAVDSYLRLRATEHGWMVGRLVVPTSHLEELAGVLVRTLKPGGASVPIVAAFVGDTASDASMSASVHTMLDPAARIESVLLPSYCSNPVDGIAGAVAAGGGIHQGALPMVAMPVGVPPGEVMSAIAIASKEALRPVGTWLDLRPVSVDPNTLATVIRAGTGLSLPFTVLSDHLPAVTQVHDHSDKLRYGALNLLAATLGADAAASDVVAVLADDKPQTYAIEFGGLTKNGEPIRSSGSVGMDRSWLVSLATLEPADTVAALGALGPSIGPSR